MQNTDALWDEINSVALKGDEAVLSALIDGAEIDVSQQDRFSVLASEFIENIRLDKHQGLMEVFLAQYGLSTDEGVALMCLAEALLRVPDTENLDALIDDKIATAAWGRHRGQSSSSLVNSSTLALMLTGKVLNTDEAQGAGALLHGMVKRLGKPVIRLAVKGAIKQMGEQFILGETISAAIEQGQSRRKNGFTYSYDMLGEAAMTAKDAQRYFQSYKDALSHLAEIGRGENVQTSPGISIKLSALHPRYETRQKASVMQELLPRVIELCLMAKQSRMGLNIDAEESERLGISLGIVDAVLKDERLADWEGLGVVVQAYNKRALPVINWLYARAKAANRKIMVRLVKGAYWDSEIKRAQVEGLNDFPVFTKKAATDVSYICCAKQLLTMSTHIYPQFATHNAHSAAAIIEMSTDHQAFEFQRLHGMGSVMHRQLRERYGTRCRIYAPVGAHEDLLAYLVRRLLENGANSSFVNQVVDEKIPAKDIAANPFAAISNGQGARNISIMQARDLYGEERRNSKGFDLEDEVQLRALSEALEPYRAAKWSAAPMLAVPNKNQAPEALYSPVNPRDCIGEVSLATRDMAQAALDNAAPWTAPSAERQAALNKAADLFEDRYAQIFAMLIREAGKTIVDAVGELREAVDFLRYYAAQIDHLDADRQARGTIVCISPWNFPLAIFTGQICAALAAGNSVIAKPAEATPLIAALAVSLLHEAGVPKTCLQFLPGEGAIIGNKLVSGHTTAGVCFTGSTRTAQAINRSMAKHAPVDALFIAETGGLNAMIVDSTALFEQAVQDVVDSAFQSAGQRCSALRVLYIQEDIAHDFLNMLYGAMEELRIGDPWRFETDIGPVISQAALEEMQNYVDRAARDERLLKTMTVPETGYYMAPSVISVSGIGQMAKEIFGPVLHVARFKAKNVDRIIKDINASGYGLTFGLHTRLDSRVEKISTGVKAGNIYVNRNQIGAVVGSQPFGGEGLSGTGPKAGGPAYLPRFTRAAPKPPREGALHESISPKVSIISEARAAQALSTIAKPSDRQLSRQEMPGPTGESNCLYSYPRGVILCLGPDMKSAKAQMKAAQDHGCSALIICPGAELDGHIDGFLDRAALTNLQGFEAVCLWSSEEDLKAARTALSRREGAILPLMGPDDMALCHLERHVCIDTTASGGNVSLLSSGSN